MIINHEHCKKLFNYILSKKYEIILDKNYNDILYIKHDNGELKCKYILIFSKIENSIIWSYENEFIDIKTKEISKKIRKIIKEEKSIVNIINKIISNDIKIKYENEEIKPLWIIINKDKNYIQYLMIIDIIYL